MNPNVLMGAVSHDNTSSLERAVANLRRLFHVTLLALILLSGSLFVFFLREVKLIRRQVVDVGQFVVEYEKSMEELRVKLENFSKTNSDFAPILNKYFAPTNLPGTQTRP